MRGALVLLSVAALAGSARADCETFGTRCGIDFGASKELLTQEDGWNQHFYHFTIPQGYSANIDVIQSTLYGNTHIFATTDGTEPTSSNSAASSLTSKIRSIVILRSGAEYNAAAAPVTVNLLVETLGETRMQFVVAPDDRSIALQLGMPLVDHVVPGSSASYDVVMPPNEDFGTIIFTVSTLAGDDPDLRVTNAATGDSAVSDTEAGDSVEISHGAQDQEVRYAMEVTTKSQGESVFLVHATVASKSHPLTLIPGYWLEDVAAPFQNRYFKLYVPQSNGELKFLSQPLYGDPNLYVNVDDFYTFDLLHGATWSSTHFLGVDEVDIEPEDPHFLHEGGVYYVTVFGGLIGASYDIANVDFGSVVQIREGRTLVDDIAAGDYHYFEFYDSSPELDMVIDVNPTAGDPDLYIACQLDPTGDDDGMPSRLDGHYVLSSNHFSEDTLEIPAGSVLLAGQPGELLRRRLRRAGHAVCHHGEAQRRHRAPRHGQPAAGPRLPGPRERVQALLAGNGAGA